MPFSVLTALSAHARLLLLLLQRRQATEPQLLRQLHLPVDLLHQPLLHQVRFFS